MRKMILASTSTLHGEGYLEYLKPELQKLFSGVKKVLFVPYARPGGMSYDAYTHLVADFFQELDIEVEGIHARENKEEAVRTSEAIFIGGGNTFVLIKELQKQNLLTCLSEQINKGVPYLGTSAGSNICGVSIHTTNDMPIVYPQKLKALQVISFNLNVHYFEGAVAKEHNGETRETRIKEFHSYHTIPVLGLREGSWLAINGGEVVLKGELSACLFEKNKEKKAFVSGTNFSFLKA